MKILQRLEKLFKQLCERNIFEMVKFRVDGPERKTKDAGAYLFRGLTFLGVLAPPKHLALFTIWSIITNVMTIFYIPIGFFFSFITSINEFSPSEFLSSLQIFVNCIGCSTKLIVFFFLYKRLIRATKYMERLDLRVCNLEGKEQIKKMVAFCNRSHTMFSILYFSYASMTLFTAVSNGKPPYQLYNPFMEWTDGPLYFFIQTSVECILICFHCYQQAVLDSYPVIYITIIRTHLHILAQRIIKLGQDLKLNSDERYEALIQCVIDHKNIMRLYNEFAQVLSGTMFVQFLIIGLILGITTIHILLFANVFAIITSIIYMISILAETFPCSFLANCLMDDSDSISLAIFHSDWPNEEPRYKQVIAYFIHQTQKTIILTAMKIFPITMNSNINVVKFAFSVYTMIKQMDFGLNIKGAREK